MDDLETFARVREEAINKTVVRELIKEHASIVLERIARGGGAANWYFCEDGLMLNKLVEKLSPGSLVSFYFDDRMPLAGFSSKLVEELNQIVVRTGEVNAGVVRVDSNHIDMCILTGPKEIADFSSNLIDGDLICYGEFPALDNDGHKAVTLMLPDQDGVLRPKPH